MLLTKSLAVRNRLCRRQNHFPKRALHVGALLRFRFGCGLLEEHDIHAKGTGDAAQRLIVGPVPPAFHLLDRARRQARRIGETSCVSL